MIDDLDADFEHSVSFLGCVQKFAKLKFLVWSFVVSSSFLSDFRHGYTTKTGVLEILLYGPFFSKVPL